MNTTILLIFLLTTGSAGMLFWALSGFVRDIPEADRHFQDPLPLGLRLIWPLVNAATFLLAPRLPAGKLEKAHHDLQTAGQDFVLNAEQLYGLRVVSMGMVVTFFWLVLAMLKRHDLTTYAATLPLGLVLGWLYPSLWLTERRKQRQRKVIKDLPTYLDFITMAVEAGLNITGGIEQATLKGPKGPLGQEFSRLLRDMRSGLSRAEALQRFADRLDMPQISSFTGTLIQADRVGASLGASLRVQADQRREERFLRAEKLALEAPVKMMLPLVMFFFPLIFIFLAYFIYLRMKQEGIV